MSKSKILFASLDDRNGTGITLHRTATRRLHTATGLLGLGPLRDSLRPRPQAHGAINGTRYQDAQPISVEGWVFGDSEQNVISEFREITGAALDTLDYGPGLFKWIEDGGLSLQRYVKMAGALDPPLTPEPGYLAYQLQFLAEDPRAYSQTLQVVTSAALNTSTGGLVFPMKFPFRYTPSSGGIASVTNNGNRSTPPVLRVYGMCVDPAVVNTTTGARITLTGTINAGDYIELDVAARTAKLNGNQLQAQLVDSANTTWFELASGTTNVQLLTGSFDSSAVVEVRFRDAYV